MHSSPLPRAPARQHGAALATALLFLVILTVLGLAAMRAGNLDLRLSQNDNDRLTAQQNAQTAVNAVPMSALNVLAGSGYLQSCAVGSSLSASSLTTQQGFTCPSDKASTTLLPSGVVFAPYLYVSVRRETAGDADYVPVAAMREGDSGDRYNLAWFTITGGYDRVAVSDGSAPQGGAEIAQGVYVKVAKIKNLTQQ